MFIKKQKKSTLIKSGLNTLEAKKASVEAERLKRIENLSVNHAETALTTNPNAVNRAVLGQVKESQSVAGSQYLRDLGEVLNASEDLGAGFFHKLHFKHKK